MEPKFTQFIKEHLYLSNVSLRTIEWYEQSLRWLNAEQPSDRDTKAMSSELNVLQRLQQMLYRPRKPVELPEIMENFGNRKCLAERRKES
jgi:hypothetical protein